MKNAFLVFLLFISGHIRSQVDIDKLVQYCDSVMNYGVEFPMIPGAVMGLASSDSILLLKGYGYSDYNKKIEVDPEKTLFQIGSIGKLFTSISLLQQVDEGKISLDDDVDNYLDGWKIRNQFDQQVTPFHLLTHTGGFNDQFIGYMAKNNSAVEPLAEHLPDHMPGLFKQPGIEINYSNYGYALAGHLVELLSGNRFQDHIKESIFDPLQMTTATYFLPDDYLTSDQYANGYLWRDTFVEAKMYPRHATPAGSTLTTGEDMMKFVQALLTQDSILLSREGYKYLLNQQFTNHPPLTGYTMGMEVQNFNGYHAIAKGGQVSGFLSIMILFSDLDLALFLSANTETDNHFENFFGGLMERFFPPRKADSLSVAFNPEEYTGNYANERCNHETIEEMFALFAGQFTIYHSESGNLQAYHNDNWHYYQHIGDDVFQDLSNRDIYMVFKRNKNGKIISLYRGVNIGGIQIPASYRKLRWTERPRFINDEYPFALTVLMTYLLLPLLWLIRFFIRKKKPSFMRRTDIAFYYHMGIFSFLGLFLWHIIGFFIPLIKLGEGMALGVPAGLIQMRYVNWAMALCSIVVLSLLIHMWIKRRSTIWFRIYYLVITLIAISYILILNRWHFLSITV